MVDLEKTKQDIIQELKDIEDRKNTLTRLLNSFDDREGKLKEISELVDKLPSGLPSKLPDQRWYDFSPNPYDHYDFNPNDFNPYHPTFNPNHIHDDHYYHDNYTYFDDRSPPHPRYRKIVQRKTVRQPNNYRKNMVT